MFQETEVFDIDAPSSGDFPVGNLTSDDQPNETVKIFGMVMLPHGGGKSK